MPELGPFKDPSSAFLQTPDPAKLFVTPGEKLLAGELPPAPVPQGSDSRRVTKIVAGLAAAFIVYRTLIHEDLPDVIPGSVREEVDKVWLGRKSDWVKIATAAILDAYKLGTTGNIAEASLEAVAQGYAEELGQYIHSTSSDALVEGVESQLLAGWSDRVAWQRAKEGYGLDGPQMRSFLTRVISGKKSEDVLPRGVIVSERDKNSVMQMLMSRADRIGEAEGWASIQSGKALSWLFMEKRGELTGKPMKRWITAEDELVCPICAPLHGVMVPLDERFDSKGHKFFAPGVHPNCRCELELIEDMPKTVIKAGYEPKRDWHGRFSEVEGRRRKGEAPTEIRRFARPTSELLTTPAAVAVLERVQQDITPIAQPVEITSPTVVKPSTSTPTVVGAPVVVGSPQVVVTPQIATPTVVAPTVVTPTVVAPTVVAPAVQTPTVVTPQIAEADTSLKGDNNLSTWAAASQSTINNSYGTGILNANASDLLAFNPDNGFGASRAIDIWNHDLNYHVKQMQKFNDTMFEGETALLKEEQARIQTLSNMMQKYKIDPKVSRDWALDYARTLEGGTNGPIYAAVSNASGQEMAALTDEIINYSDSALEVAQVSTQFTGYELEDDFYNATGDYATFADVMDQIFEHEISVKQIEVSLAASYSEMDLLGSAFPAIEIIEFADGHSESENGVVTGMYKLLEEPTIAHWNSASVPSPLREAIRLSIPSSLRDSSGGLKVKIYRAIPAEQTEEE